MDIQRLPISRLHPAPYNPRLALQPGDKRFERLARSLTEFDLVQPLVWNKRTGHLVGGHQRLEVLRHKGVTEVECVVVDLPLEREKALNIALNNSEVGGDWELERLSEILCELSEVPDFDPTLTGFDEQKLRDLMFQPSLPPEPEDDDEASEVVMATLEVDPGDWPDIQRWLNSLLEDFPDVRLHVRQPRSHRT